MPKVEVKTQESRSIARLFKTLSKTTDNVSYFVYILGGILCFILGFLVFCSSVSRYIINQPIPGANEISLYMMYLMPFLAAPWLLKTNKHVTLDVLMEYTPPKIQLILVLFSSFICLVVSILIFIYSTILTYQQYLDGTIIIDSIEPPRYLLFSIIPICFFLFSLISLKKLYQAISTLLAKK